MAYKISSPTRATSHRHRASTLTVHFAATTVCTLLIAMTQATMTPVASLGSSSSNKITKRLHMAIQTRTSSVAKSTTGNHKAFKIHSSVQTQSSTETAQTDDLFVSVSAPTACTTSQIFADDCQYRMDGECDAGQYCNMGTDCYDCDPCRIFDGTTCSECVAAVAIDMPIGTVCVWAVLAGGFGVCSSTYLAASMPTGTALYSTCDDAPAPETTSTCDMATDSCIYSFDLECDADGIVCPLGTDCYDCDPCLAQSSCDACVASTGCAWCETPDLGGICNTGSLGVCSILNGTPFFTTCPVSVPSTDTSPSPPFPTIPPALSPSSSSISGTCNVLTDACSSSWQFDLDCDADGILCAPGSDCFDCDPCQAFALDCEACVAEGCWYASFPSSLYPGTDIGICSSPSVANDVPYIAINEGGTAYQSSCTSGGEPVGSTTCDFDGDTCSYQLDGVCDAGSYCDVNSDCFDCDPCQAYTSCDGCTQADCLWCNDGLSGQCSSSEAAKAFPNACGYGTSYARTCSSSGGGGGETTTDDIVPPTSYTCDGSADTCISPFNGKCDANIWSCSAVNSDCFDCDPCQAYRFQGCEACTSAPEECQWCGADAICKSPGVAVSETMMTCAESDFVTSCPASTTAFFPDPLYDSMVWLYDMVKVRPVWEAGYSKSMLFAVVDYLL
jgi:hypothetical protein